MGETSPSRGPFESLSFLYNSSFFKMTIRSVQSWGVTLLFGSCSVFRCVFQELDLILSDIMFMAVQQGVLS